MTRMRILLAALVTLATTQIAAALTWPWQDEGAPAPTPPRPIASITVADSPPPAHSIPGVVAARVEVTLGFQTLGRVNARNVDIGSVVRWGDVLATLDPDDLQGDVRAAQAAVDATRVELQTATATAQRTRALAARNVASTAQLEQAERALAAAEAAALQAQSELIRARDAEGFAEMKAPFDGVISAVYANPGAVVSTGEPVLRLSSQEGQEAVIDLSEGAMARIELGDDYEVWSKNDPGNPQPASVSRIEPVTDPATRTRRAHLSLPNDSGFRLGALIQARPAGGDKALISLPRAAVLDNDGTSQVWIVTRNGTEGTEGTVSLRDITVSGPPQNGLVSVASGLSPGDEVVIRGIHSLTEGQPVGRSVTP